MTSSINNRSNLYNSVTSPNRGGNIGLSLSGIKSPKNDYLNSIKVFPSSNPIRQPSPDNVLKTEKIHLTTNPGAFYFFNRF